MAVETETPSRMLKLVRVVVDFIGIFLAVRLFGFVLGVIAAVAATSLPRTTRRQTYISIALTLAFVVLAGMILDQRLNAIREWEGVESPAFAFTTIDGKRVDSAQLRGKRVVLNFWATWCAPCRIEIPEINRLFVAESDADVAVFGLANESEETIRKFLDENTVDYPLVSITAAQLPSPYRDVAAVPTTFVLDRNGIIQFIRPGFIGPDELQATIWDADDYRGQVKTAPTLERAGSASLRKNEPLGPFQ